MTFSNLRYEQLTIDSIEKISCTFSTNQISGISSVGVTKSSKHKAMWRKRKCGFEEEENKTSRCRSILCMPGNPASCVYGRGNICIYFLCDWWNIGNLSNRNLWIKNQLKHKSDLEFVKKFTRPNFRPKEFYTLKTRKLRLFSPAISSKNASLSVIWSSYG